MASSLVAKSRTMLERGSAVLAQPIRLFSHLCWLSNSIFHLRSKKSSQEENNNKMTTEYFFWLFNFSQNMHLLIPAVPDCMGFLAGLKILTLKARIFQHKKYFAKHSTCRSFLSASGMPEVIVTSAGPSTFTSKMFQARKK